MIQDHLAENAADGVTGFVVLRRGPKALAEKMALLTESPGLRKSFGLAGMECVKKACSPSKNNWKLGKNSAGRCCECC